MAFEVRVEFWKITDLGDGLNTVVLDTAVADALEIDAAYEEAGPILANREVIAMSVFGVSGNAYVQADPEAALVTAGARARLVTPGTQHWFMLHPDHFIKVDEKV